MVGGWHGTFQWLADLAVLCPCAVPVRWQAVYIGTDCPSCARELEAAVTALASDSERESPRPVWFLALPVRQLRHRFELFSCMTQLYHHMPSIALFVRVPFKQVNGGGTKRYTCVCVCVCGGGGLLVRR